MACKYDKYDVFKSDVMTRFADMMFRKTKFFEEMFSPSSEDSDQDQTKGK